MLPEQVVTLNVVWSHPVCHALLQIKQLHFYFDSMTLFCNNPPTEKKMCELATKDCSIKFCITLS